MCRAKKAALLNTNRNERASRTVRGTPVLRSGTGEESGTAAGSMRAFHEYYEFMNSVCKVSQLSILHLFDFLPQNLTDGGEFPNFYGEIENLKKLCKVKFEFSMWRTVDCGFGTFS